MCGDAGLELGGGHFLDVDRGGRRRMGEGGGERGAQEASASGAHQEDDGKTHRRECSGWVAVSFHPLSSRQTLLAGCDG
jgi:hypothetical protein